MVHYGMRSWKGDKIHEVMINNLALSLKVVGNHGIIKQSGVIMFSFRTVAKFL